MLPARINRGQPDFNRGKRQFNRGKSGFNRGKRRFNRGKSGFNRGKWSFNRGKKRLTPMFSMNASNYSLEKIFCSLNSLTEHLGFSPMSLTLGAKAVSLT